MALVNKIGSRVMDGLIAHIFPKAHIVGVTLAKLASDADPVVLQRGAVLALNKDGTVSPYGGGSATGEEKFDGDGTAKTFTVAAKPASIISVMVGDTAATITDYNAYTGVVTLSAAPAAGTKNVVVTYAVEATGVPAYILFEDEVTVTDEADVVVRAYRSGNFDRALLKLPEGVTLSAADEDELRQRDIILSDSF